MMSDSNKRLRFYWTAPKNFLAILIFVILSIIIQYIIVVSATRTILVDKTSIILPFNFSISLLYHLLPIIVIITLSTCFIHLATHTALMSPRTQISKRTSQQIQKPIARKPLQKFNRRIRKGFQKMKKSFLRNPSIASVQRRIVLAKAIIKSAIYITAAFIILFVLISAAANPKLVPTITENFFQWNTDFVDFVVSTIETSQVIANTIPPLGALATVFHDALISIAPAFRNTMEGAASTLSAGLVALDPTAKYIVIQNIATWAVAISTILYTYYFRISRRRR